MKNEKCRPDCARSGFTMVEMAIVVAIVGLITAIAVPNIVKQLPSRRMNQSMWELTSNLRTARVQAMSEGIPVKLLYNHTAGIMVFWADRNGNGVQNSGETNQVALVADYKGTQPWNGVGQFLPDGRFILDAPYEGQHFYVYLRLLDPSIGHSYYYLDIWPTGQVTVDKEG